MTRFEPQPPAPALRAVHPFVAPVLPRTRGFAHAARGCLLIENHALPLVSVEVDIDVGIDE